MYAKSILVLLLEDEISFTTLVVEILNTLGATGIEIVFAYSLQEGARILRERETEIDLILLDLNLPDSKGLDTVRRAVLLVPKIPIVVVTSLPGVEGEIGREIIRLGAQEVIPKELILQPHTLLRVILFSIERGRHRAALIEYAEAERERAEEERRRAESLAQEVAELERVINSPLDSHAIDSLRAVHRNLKQFTNAMGGG